MPGLAQKKITVAAGGRGNYKTDRMMRRTVMQIFIFG
jgi:hypothetical protein